MQNSYNFPQESLKSRRFEAAVSVSAKLFLEKGIDTVKMTDIANETGIGVATLYRYFGTKTRITIAAMTYLWNDMNKMFSGIFESEVFLKQPGIKQLSDLMRMTLVFYNAHRDFMKLLGEFDLFLIRENVPKEELEGYESSVINFYPFFEKAYAAGLADGTVREVENFQLCYLTYAHALMELAKKLMQGELLPSDNFSNASQELSLLIETAVYFLRKEPLDGAENSRFQ
jgi:AcrR family transcriptional regulator